MSREMRELAPLLTLAPSSFELRRPTVSKSQAHEGLQKLSSLATVTEGSLPNEASASPPAPASHAPITGGDTPARVQPPLSPVDYASRTQDYQPALKDRSVVDALLDFHRKSFAPSSAPLSGFRAERIPQVPSVPKPSGSKVFRSK